MTTPWNCCLSTFLSMLHPPHFCLFRPVIASTGQPLGYKLAARYRPGNRNTFWRITHIDGLAATATAGSA
jgi:hypothetical protein